MVAVSALLPSKQVALEAADLQREPAAVDQQPHHDLRVDPAFLGVADLAQLVFALGFEVQRGHVVEHQGDVATGGRVLEAPGGDLVAVGALMRAGQGAAHRLLARRRAPEVGEHPRRVQDRGRFHQPGNHQVPEDLVAQRVEPQPGEHPGEHVVEHPRGRRHDPRRSDHPALPRRGSLLPEEDRVADGGADQRRLHRHRLDAEVQFTLSGIVQKLPRPLQQQAELRVGVRGAHMRDDPPPAPHGLSDLHGRRPRRRPHPPNPGHRPTVGPPISASETPTSRHNRRSGTCRSPIREPVTKLRSDAAWRVAQRIPSGDIEVRLADPRSMAVGSSQQPGARVAEEWPSPGSRMTSRNVSVRVEFGGGAEPQVYANPEATHHLVDRYSRSVDEGDRLIAKAIRRWRGPLPGANGSNASSEASLRATPTTPRPPSRRPRLPQR
jgi:hypothetical protein